MNCRGSLFSISLAIELSAPGFCQAQPGRKISELLEATPALRSAFWGIEAVDLDTGKTVFSRDASSLFTPASNIKLFTAALALDRLGPDFHFRTRVLSAEAPDRDGVVRGALFLVGGGDPNLSAREVPYRKGPVTGNPLGWVEEMADQVASRGVKKIAGSVIGDDTWYVWEPHPEGWTVAVPQNTSCTSNASRVAISCGFGARCHCPLRPKS